MNILKKLLTAVRGSARELGEAVIDANGIRILEQEVEDAKNSLMKAKDSLATVMAKEMQGQRELKGLADKISENENYARQALEKGDEGLALQIAEKIAELEAKRDEQNVIQHNYQEHVTSLKAQIRKAEKNIAENERQLLMVKTTDSVQKATLTVTENITSNQSRMHSARESLERIRQKQQDTADRLKAGEMLDNEVNGNELEDKLKAAGIKPTGPDAASVLDRLKKQ